MTKKVFAFYGKRDKTALKIKIECVFLIRYETISCLHNYAQKIHYGFIIKLHLGKNVYALNNKFLNRPS